MPAYRKALLPLGEKGWDEGSLPLEEREKTGRLRRRHPHPNPSPLKGEGHFDNRQGAFNR